MVPRNPNVEKVDLLEGRKEFDMRRLHSFDLLQPSLKVLPSNDKSREEFPGAKQKLIY